LIVLLHDFAARIETASDEHGYVDNQAVRLENGRKALDYKLAALKPSSASIQALWVGAFHYWVRRSIVVKKREKLNVAFGYATIENDSSSCKGASDSWRDPSLNLYN
jgi:hypothetical protein